MVRHASDEELIALCLADAGRAAPGPAAPDRALAWTRAHLDGGCARCRSRLVEIETLVAALGAPPLREAPDEFLERASDWLSGQARAPSRARPAPRPRSVRPLEQAWEEVLANLVFDGSTGMLLAGVRGAPGAGHHQLLYESAWGSVHLRTEPGGGGGTLLRGQFLPSDAELPLAGVTARWTAGGRTRTCRLSATGEFAFDRVPQTPMRVTLEWSRRRVVLERVVLAGDPDG